MLHYVTGFDLIFQKWFVSFPNKNNGKTDLKFCAPRLLDKEKFEIYQRCIFLQKTFIKKNCINQLCQKQFENMQNFTYMQKRTRSAFIKTLQIKLLSLPAAKSLTLGVSPILSITPLENEVCAAIKCSISPSDN